MILMIAMNLVHDNHITASLLLRDDCSRASMSLCHVCKKRLERTKATISCCPWAATSCTKTLTAGSPTDHYGILTYVLFFTVLLSSLFNRYRNLDRLIAAVNADGRVHARYSTPDEYADAKHASNLTWPIKFDDFFPYSSDAHEVWR